MLKHKIVIDDQTTYEAVAPAAVEIKENILIVGTFQKGRTNQLIQFNPGEYQQWIDEFGSPNYFKYGVGPNIALKALDNNLNMGVLAINLRPSSARIANAILVAKYKVLPDVQKINATGDPLYLTPEGTESTISTGNTAIVRDVLELKFGVVASSNVKTKADMYTELDIPYSDTADTDGYKTIPLFAFFYAGSGKFGDNLNFRMVDRESPYDGTVVYDIELFNGSNYVTINGVSLFPDAEMFAGQSIFIENMLKNNRHMNVISSGRLDDFIELVSQYTSNPKELNIFDITDKYAIKTAATTLDVTAPHAVALSKCMDGVESELPALYKSFFDSAVVADLDSIIRYRIDLIPDLEYSTEVKASIMNLLKRRNNTTQFIMMAGTNTFESAIADRQNNYLMSDDSNTLMIAACQNPVFQDPYTKRALKFPAIYFATTAYIDNYKRNQNSFMALAGAAVRWTGFDPDSLICAPSTEAQDKLFDDARINIVKMDNEQGAFIASQNTNTKKLSDRTEFNNMRIMAHIIYRIAHLVHRNGYKFNDMEDIEKFQEKVQLDIYPEFRGYVSGLSAHVYKKGLVGEDKNTNLINIKINFKDLAKSTETTITITDNEIK